MVAWNKAVIANTDAGYRTFLAQYPDSDLTLTARKLEERRGSTAAAPTASTSSPADIANAPVATPQSGAAPGAVKKTETPARKPKRVERQVAPRSPSYGGGGSYGGGDIRSGY
jgi:hypothetical protein